MKYAFLLLAACATTSHPTTPSDLGAPSSWAAMEDSLATPGTASVETIAAADWVVPLSGLLNTDRAGIADHEEPIQIFVHVIRHPTRGTFLVDTGVERDLRTIPGWMKRAIHTEKIAVHEDTATIAARAGHIDGVLLTHVHLDHVLGLQDLPKDTPIYSGKGDSADRSFEHALTQGMFDDFLAGFSPVRELAGGVVDLFGDGSVWAIASPGHTPGTTAYLVRTPSGAVLLTGDACHTRIGWERSIEPGSFSSDQPQSRESLLALKALVERHPAIDVRLGHQR